MNLQVRLKTVGPRWVPVLGYPGFRVLGFRVQHLKSEHSLVKQLVKRWKKNPPTQKTHNIEKIQSSLNTFPIVSFLTDPKPEI